MNCRSTARRVDYLPRSGFFDAHIRNKLKYYMLMQKMPLHMLIAGYILDPSSLMS